MICPPALPTRLPACPAPEWTSQALSSHGAGHPATPLPQARREFACVSWSLDESRPDKMKSSRSTGCVDMSAGLCSPHARRS